MIMAKNFATLIASSDQDIQSQISNPVAIAHGEKPSGLGKALPAFTRPRPVASARPLEQRVRRYL